MARATDLGFRGLLAGAGRGVGEWITITIILYSPLCWYLYSLPLSPLSTDGDDFRKV